MPLKYTGCESGSKLQSNASELFLVSVSHDGTWGNVWIQPITAPLQTS